MKYRILLCGLILSSVPAFARQVQIPNDAVRFATLWRGVDAEIKALHCTSTQCYNAVATIQGILPRFEAGGDPTVLFAQLVTDWRALDAVLRNDFPATYNADAAIGAYLAEEARHKSGGMTGGTVGFLLSTDSCLQNCDRTFAMVIVLCSILPPPADAFCLAAAVASYLGCQIDCRNRGQAAGIATPPVLRPQIPASVQASLEPARFQSIAPTLVGRFSVTAIQDAYQVLLAISSGGTQ